MKLTIEDIAKDVAEKALEDLQVNNMPLTEFIVKVDSVTNFLKSEIRICEERLQNYTNIFYDGACVGVKQARELTHNHIRFCKKILEMMNFEE